MNGEGDYDDLFANIQNPSFMEGGENDENDNVGAISGDDDDDHHQDGGRVRKLARHNPQQIEELEKFFMECPLPNEKTRSEIAQRLNLTTKQIKFWFQNKRVQERAQRQLHEYLTLKKEYERLREEHERLKQELLFAKCNTCGGTTNSFMVQQLVDENGRLKQEISFLKNYYPNQPPVANPSSLDNPVRHAAVELDLGPKTFTFQEGATYWGLATTALNELTRLGQMNSSFWKMDETLNYEEYTSYFNNGIITKPPGYVMEASRASGSVLMNCLALVKTLMNVSKWVSVFGGHIVTVASAQRIINKSNGGSQNGSLQLIEAEFQVICPFIQKRKVKFLRYCKMLKKGEWVVVDVTPPGDEENQNLMYENGVSKRLPSGVIISDIGNGCSQVTWIEQTEYDESEIDQPYKLLIGSGTGLGAKRWLTTLQRYCESYSTLSSTTMSQVYRGIGLSSKGASEMVKLADRVTLRYLSGITGSQVGKWEKYVVENEGQNKRFMTRKNANELGEHTGIVLSASTCVWFPVNYQTLFEFLSDTSFRNKWDILTRTSSVETTILIQKSKCQSNNVSLLQILGNGIRVVQESWNDTSGAYMVYAPVANHSMEEVLGGADADSVKILPSGFSILPDGVVGGGCLLSFGVQALVSNKPTDQLNQDSVKTIVAIIDHTIANIQSAFYIQN